MCSEVSKVDDAPQRGLVFFLQRFQDFFIAVFAEQLVAVFVRGSRWVMRFIVLLQVQHCQFAQGERFCSGPAASPQEQKQRRLKPNMDCIRPQHSGTIQHGFIQHRSSAYDLYLTYPYGLQGGRASQKSPPNVVERPTAEYSMPCSKKSYPEMPTRSSDDPWLLFTVAA